MNRRSLVRKIAREAQAQRLNWFVAREGADHTIFMLDGLMVTVPRHNEINQLTAIGILKRCEAKFGTRWWK